MDINGEHLDDLRKSGLNDETIYEAKISSVSDGNVAQILGFIPDGLESAYKIPFRDNGYCRLKTFWVQGKEFYKDGKPKPKYLSRKDSGNKLYIAKNVKPVLQDVSVPLYITEGEKKALKACQEGLYCIAITGLWNWKVKDKDELIPDFDKIALSGRTIYLVPDNDWLEPNRKGGTKNLEQAVYDFAYLLIDKGCKVHWVKIPQEEA